MEKISAEQALSIFEDAVTALPKLAHERDNWKSKYKVEAAKVASYERRDAINKIASAMIDKNLDGGASHGELVEHLEVWAQQGKLAEVERAVELAGPDMGRKIAQVHDSGGGGGYEGGGETGVSGSGGDFVRYLLDGNA